MASEAAAVALPDPQPLALMEGHLLLLEQGQSPKLPVEYQE